MTRHFGRAALVCALLSWPLLYGALALGGLDPRSDQMSGLRAASGASLIAALAAMALGIAAIVRRRQRVAAGVALAIALAFLLLYSGWGFALAALLTGNAKPLAAPRP